MVQQTGAAAAELAASKRVYGGGVVGVWECGCGCGAAATGFASWVPYVHIHGLLITLARRSELFSFPTLQTGDFAFNTSNLQS